MMRGVVAAASVTLLGCFLIPSYEVRPPTATEAANAGDNGGPREERPPDRPGYVWVYGHYAPNPDGTYSWQRGYFLPERLGYLWVQGSLEQQADGRHVWHEGYWVRSRDP